MVFIFIKLEELKHILYKVCQELDLSCQKNKLGQDFQNWMSSTDKWIMPPKYWHSHYNLWRRALLRAWFDFQRIGTLLYLIGKTLLIFKTILFWFFLSNTKDFWLPLFKYYATKECDYQKEQQEDWLICECQLKCSLIVCGHLVMR